MAVEAGDIRWRIIGDIEGLNRAMSDAKAQTEARFGQISRTAGIAMTAVGAAITGALGLSVKSAMDFGAEMANVATLGVKDFEGLKKGVEDLSITFGLDLNDAAKQLYQTISAGIPEDAAISVLGVAAKGAQAGVGSLSTALDLGTSTMNAWGMKGQNAAETTANFEKIMGLAATTVKMGKTTIDEMAASIGPVAPLMATAGVSTEDFFGAIGALTATGTPASVAMNSLRQVVANIITPTKDAADMAKSLGLEFDVGALKSKGFASFMEDVRAKTGGSTEKMSALFGSVEALGSVLTLTGSQAENFKNIVEQMGNAQKNLNEMSDAYIAANPALAFAQLKAEVTVLAVNIGESLLPTLKRVVEFIKPIVSGIADWVRAHPTLTSALSITAAAIGGLMLVLGPLLIMLPGIVAAVGLVGGSFAAIAAPIAIAIAAVVAIGAAAYLLISNWEEIPAALQAVWDTIVAAVGAALQTFGNIIGAGMAAVVWAFTHPLDAIAAAWSGIVDFFKGVWDGITGVFRGGMAVVNSIMDSLGKAWDWVTGNIGEGIAQGATGSVPAMASGGTVAQSGWALVGERGPELVQFAQGSTVYDAQQTAQAVQGGQQAAQAAPVFHVNFGRDSVRSDDDIRTINQQLAGLVQNALRGYGWAT